MGATRRKGRTAVALRRRARFRGSRVAASRLPWTYLLGVVLSAEIVVWTGVATNWFRPTSSTTSSGTTPTGPNPNPYDEVVQAVFVNVTYSGNLSGYFPALQDQDVCGHCPARPFTDENYSPPVAGFWFYFNVTNTAAYWETIANFTLSTSGANPQLFTPGYAKCCYPNYNIYVGGLGFTPGQAFGLEVFVYAASLPDVGSAGFTLYFNVTAP